MAVKDTEKFLKDMRVFMEREYKRGALDRFSTIVTMSDKGFAEGFKQGYNSIQSNRDEGERLIISNKEFLEIGSACVNKVAEWAQKAKTQGHELEYIPGKLLRYRANRDLKTPYTMAKNEGIRLINKKLKESGKRELQKAQSRKEARTSEVGLVKSTVHRAHQGVTTVGSAQVSAAMKFLDQTRSFAGFSTSEEAREISDILKEIRLTFNTTGTKSGSKLSQVKLNEDLSVEISVVAQKSNRAGSEPYDFKRLMPKLEQAITRYVASQNIAGMPGSDSIEDDAVNRVEYAILSELSKPKSAKLKTKVKKPAGRAKRSKKVNSSYAKKSTKGSSKKAAVSAASRTKRVPRAKRSEINLAQLLGIFNARINATVANNMGYPALTNQSGRLASSVRITDIAVTPQGFPSVGYTYQKGPYQTFEPGYAQGSPEFDPRVLIDKSIREIAATMTLGRLYTRRL